MKLGGGASLLAPRVCGSPLRDERSRGEGGSHPFGLLQQSVPALASLKCECEQGVRC